MLNEDDKTSKISSKKQFNQEKKLLEYILCTIELHLLSKNMEIGGGRSQ